jgi:hypothetical protein
VLIGANGAGKSNLLEAVGVLSAAADGKVNDQTLLQRGVRPGVPSLYKSSFHSNSQQASHISFGALSESARYDVSLINPMTDPTPGWRFKTELLQSGSGKVTSRSPNSRNNPNTELGLAALKLVELDANDPALLLMQDLQHYVIYSPTTAILRGVAPEPQPRQPLGLSGGRLPEAVTELLRGRANNAHIDKVCREALGLIDWASSYGAAQAAGLPLSPAASSATRVIKFVDKYMKSTRNVLSGYDASEGALYVLFLAVLAAHPKAPRFFAIDNVDHGLNPGLAADLMKRLSDWILIQDMPRQIIMTSHNPAVLDGLPLQDERVRLFAVERDNHGKTTIRRVVVDGRMQAMSAKGWTLSRMWMNKLIGGVPNV